jgi:predicted nucleotidyltransferase
MSNDELIALPNVAEGLHNLLSYNAKTASKYSELLESVKSKRYTMARIKRICMCALLGITANEQKETPKYIHILGVKKSAKQLLSYLSENATLPIIIKGTDSKDLEPEAKRLFDLDVTATNIYSLIAKTQRLSDYFSEFLIV